MLCHPGSVFMAWLSLHWSLREQPERGQSLKYETKNRFSLHLSTSEAVGFETEIKRSLAIQEMFPSQANHLTSNTNNCACKVLRITEWQQTRNMQCPVILQMFLPSSANHKIPKTLALLSRFMDGLELVIVPAIKC